MTARPRLLILTADFPPPPGGIQLVAHRLATGIEAFETRVVAIDRSRGERAQEEDRIAVRRVGGGHLPHKASAAILNAVAVADARGFRPDVVLSMHMVASPAAAAIRRTLGVPVVQYFHAEEIGARPRLAAFAAAHADAVIGLSHYTAELLAEAGAAPRNLALIPPGVDLPRDPTPLPAERPTFLTIARMEERYKGHDVLVRALALVRAKIPDVHWVAVGDGSLRPGYEAQADAYGVADSISFLGRVTDEERDAWLRRANLLAMPSRLPAGGYGGEGFGIVFMEAAVYGKPVVAGGVGGALDAISDGESGLLVDPNDQMAVAEAIAGLLGDPELAARLGRFGQQRAQAFAWPVIVRRVEELLLGQLAVGAIQFDATPAQNGGSFQAP